MPLFLFSLSAAIAHSPAQPQASSNLPLIVILSFSAAFFLRYGIPFLFFMNPRNFKKLIKKLDAKLMHSLYRKSSSMQDSILKIQYLFSDHSFTYICELKKDTFANLPNKFNMSVRSTSYSVAHLYEIPFDKPKTISELTLSRTNRFFYGLIPSTVDISGNEDRTLRVIYRHNSEMDPNSLQNMIESLLPIELIQKIKSLKKFTLIKVYPNKATIETPRPIEDDETLALIFDILLSFSKCNNPPLPKIENPEAELALRAINIVLNCINQQSVTDDPLFSKDFKVKFQSLLEQLKPDLNDGVKIHVTVSPSPIIKTKTRNHLKEITIADPFPVVTTPRKEELETSPDTMSSWKLTLDARTNQLVAMDEDIWGNFIIK
jgi:hypothetical protein